MKDQLNIQELKAKIKVDKEQLLLLEASSEELSDLFKSEKQNTYISNSYIKDIIEKLAKIYESSRGNPITLAKQVDLILSNFLDLILEDWISKKNIKLIASEEEDSSENSKKIEEAKDFVITFIKTLVKSLNLYKSNLQ
jgi:lipoate-protein ligase A